MGATAMPPRAPIAAEMAKARMIIRPVLTPERLAAPGSLAVAVICLPTRVRLVSSPEADQHHDHEADHPKALGEDGDSADEERLVTAERRYALAVAAPADAARSSRRGC